jgi:hypothetical protein
MTLALEAEVGKRAAELHEVATLVDELALAPNGLQYII